MVNKLYVCCEVNRLWFEVFCVTIRFFCVLEKVMIVCCLPGTFCVPVALCSKIASQTAFGQ